MRCYVIRIGLLMTLICMLLLFASCVQKDDASGLPKDSEEQAASPEEPKQDNQEEQLGKSSAVGITMYVGSTEALVDGVPTQMPAAPFVEHGIFFFPMQFVAEAFGWDYSFQNDVVTVGGFFEEYTYSGNVISHTEIVRNSTEFFMDSRGITVDGVDGLISGNYTLFQAGGPTAAAIDDNFVPILKEGIVFLPFNFESNEINVPFHFFYGQQYPSYNMVIFNSHNRDEGIGGIYVWDVYDDLPEARRSSLKYIGVVGESRDVYNVVEYGGNGLFVHVLRLQEGAEDQDELDGVVSCVYVTNPDIATPRGLRCGDTQWRAWEIYGSEFCMHFSYDLSDGVISRIGFFSYYDVGSNFPDIYINDTPAKPLSLSKKSSFGWAFSDSSGKKAMW